MMHVLGNVKTRDELEIEILLQYLVRIYHVFDSINGFKEIKLVCDLTLNNFAPNPFENQWLEICTLEEGQIVSGCWHNGSAFVFCPGDCPTSANTGK